MYPQNHLNFHNLTTKVRMKKSELVAKRGNENGFFANNHNIRNLLPPTHWGSGYTLRKQCNFK